MTYVVLLPLESRQVSPQQNVILHALHKTIWRATCVQRKHPVTKPPIFTPKCPTENSNGVQIFGWKNMLIFKILQHFQSQACAKNCMLNEIAKPLVSWTVKFFPMNI